MSDEEKALRERIDELEGHRADLRRIVAANSRASWWRPVAASIRVNP